MKKTARLLMCAALLLSVTGCGAKETAADTVNAFWSALENGDVETAKNYVSDQAYQEIETLNAAADSLIAMTESYDLPEDTVKVINEFSANVIRVTYKSHNVISSKEISKDEYEVTASVQVADPVSLTSALSEIDYQAELGNYQDEIVNAVTEEGIQQAYGKVFLLIFSYLNEHVEEISEKLSYTDNEVVMKVIRNESGKWLITDITGQGKN